MKFRLPLVMLLAALIFGLIAAPVAAQVADGTYQVNYEVKQADNDNASIADGYFQKPASVTVKNGVYTVTFDVTGSDMVKSLSSRQGSVKVVGENEANKTRTYQLQVNDLSRPITMDMHIVVPDLYDQEHSARFVFDTSGLPEAGSESDSGAETTAAGDGEEVENPKTGEDSSIALYSILLLASVVGLVAIWKFRPARN